MAKQYSRREIMTAIMLGGGVIAGELWWPGQKLISIPAEPEILVYRATMSFGHGWVDERGVFGLSPVKEEGSIVTYDADILEGNQEQVWSYADDIEMNERIRKSVIRV